MQPGLGPAWYQTQGQPQAPSAQSTGLPRSRPLRLQRSGRQYARLMPSWDSDRCRGGYRVTERLRGFQWDPLSHYSILNLKTQKVMLNLCSPIFLLLKTKIF